MTRPGSGGRLAGATRRPVPRFAVPGCAVRGRAVRGLAVPSLAALLLALAAPAAAREGGTIRSGEHASFSRVVMIVQPTTEWSLEIGARSATITFPGRAIPFSTAGIFERMPRSRITAVETATGPEGTAVTLTLGCDCRVSTAFVGARYLAVDVHEPGRVLRAPPAGTSGDAAAAPLAPTSRSVEEALASAERILLDQLERAASQGLVELAEGTTLPDLAELAEALLPDGPDASAPPAAAPPAVPARPPAFDPPRPPALATPPGSGPAAGPGPEPGPPAFASEGDRLLAHLATTMSGAHEQVTATTVFDRDSRAARAARDAAPVPPVCREDEAFDLARWSDGRPLIDQAVALQARLVGEFDRADPLAVAALARLYIRHGLGAEAGLVLRGFGVAVEDGALLADLARIVEDRPPAPDGPLAVEVACPDRHGLWLARAGSPAQLADEARFPSLRRALEDLPPELRALIGPGLVTAYLEAGRGAEARIVHDIVIRPGQAPDRAMALATGRLAAFEGRVVEAEVHLGTLVAANAPNAADALFALVRLRLDGGGRVPPAWLTDLEATALEHRGATREIEARALAAEARARNGDLPGAMAALAALAAEVPAARERAGALAARLLAAAGAARAGEAPYARAALAHAELLPGEAAHDAERLAIAEALLEIGLPGPALAVLDAALARGVEPARRLAARARLAASEPLAALGHLRGLEDGEARALRARALARREAFDAAAETLAGAGERAAALPYAWAAGRWDLAADLPDETLAAMAAYMRDREAGSPASPPAAAPSGPPAPEAAFRPPPPRAAAPSLAGARALIETGAAVEDLVGRLLDAGE